MIDEFFQRNAPKVGRATANAATGTGNILLNAIARFSAWFDDFRWIEFSAAVTAATAAGLAMADQLHLPVAVAKKVGAFGGIVTAIAFIRSPKTRWKKCDDTTVAEDGE